MSIRALVGISVVFLSPLLAEGLRPGTIFSVLVTNDSVFASTRTDLYRASRSEKNWVETTLPEGVQPGGPSQLLAAGKWIYQVLLCCV
jgi:hypothetical protein